MAGVDYYHCENCGKKMLYIHSEESEIDKMYCSDCWERLKAELAKAFGDGYDAGYKKGIAEKKAGE